MAKLAALRRWRERIIMRDPIQVVVHRADSSGPVERGRRPRVESDLEPQTVRIVQHRQSVQTQRETAYVPGDISYATRYMALAFHDSDFRAEAQVLDEFTTDRFGKFQVREVIPEGVEGGLYGVTLELERVS